MKQGKKHSKIIIVLLIIIAIIVITTFILLGRKNSNKIENNDIENNNIDNNNIEKENIEDNTTENVENVKNNESVNIANNSVNMSNKENVDIKGNEKINTSNQIKSTKKIGNLSYIIKELKTTNDEIVIEMLLKNEGQEKFEGREISINFMNNNGDLIGSINSYIGKIETGKEKTLKISTTLDITNAYDYNIKLK